LLDAGNSPAQLARQCVRYLRNALIAKVAGLGVDGADAAGVGSELLQVSPDEQKRAARTAALFSEEELTRFLQVMLRTFDELGYRQEQRFHFELGLIKLVHLRRLLPMEEVLSQLGGRGVSGAGAGRVAGVSAARPVVAAAAAPVATSVAKPAFSPFEQDKRRRPEGTVSASGAGGHGMVGTRGATAVSVAPIAVARSAAETMPMAMPAAVRLPEAMAIVQPSREEAIAEEQRDVALPVEVFETTAGAADAGAMQRAVVEALAAARQQSAADVMGDAVWMVVEGEARVETTLSKTMLGVVMNAEAEKVARGAMRGMKLVLLPGAEAVSAVKKVRVARVGTAEARAKEHPVVQQAQRLFNAEIRNVIDLREGE
jgi:DNA polymerase-3 subunit gamma/tau